MMKQKEKVGMVEAQVTRAQKDRENLQSEMEILLDRINKLSELLDKARVSALLITLRLDADHSLVIFIRRAELP